MPSISLLAVLAATASLVSAAPRKRQQFSHTLGPAPFQGTLPTISAGVTPIDLDLSSYSAYGWPDDSDQFRCHGTCGILIRISRTKETCNHPYAEPFSAYCVGQCSKADPGSVYPPAKVFAQQCKFDVNRPPREVPKDDEKKDDEKKDDEKKPDAKATPTESSTQAPASTASSSAAKDAPTTTASPVPTASPSKASPSGTSVVSSASPSKAPVNSSASPVSSAAPTGTGAPSAATPTGKTIVEVTGGASKPFGFTAAISVAALTMLAVY